MKKDLKFSEMYLEGLINELNNRVEDIADFLNNPELSSDNSYRKMLHELNKIRAVLSYAETTERLDNEAKLLTGPV